MVQIRRPINGFGLSLFFFWLQQRGLVYIVVNQTFGNKICESLLKNKK